MLTLLVIGGTGFFGKSILDGFRRGTEERDILKKAAAYFAKQSG